MKRPLWPCALLLAALLAGRAAAQAAAPPGIIGTWRGTSTCVNPGAFPACHDEVVVYEVRRHTAAADSVVVRADKVVDGAREFMGELTFGRGADGTWCGVFQSRRGSGRWTLTVQGDRMTGELRDVSTGLQVRMVALGRVS